jgi:Peptidase family S41
MRKYLILACLTCIPSAALFATDTTPAEKPVNWRTAAITDLEAAYKETAENHPGMFDKTNPDFPALLAKARAAAMQLAKKTKTAGGYEAVMGRFKSVLNDGHAGAYTNVPEKLSPPIRWPGFVAAWRGEAMYVYKSDAGGPIAGAQITTCDGKPIKALVERNVFDYRSGRSVPGDWWSNARRLFVDTGNPFIKLPKNCTFVANGKAEQRQLTWSALPDHYQAWKDGSANGERLPIGLTEKSPGFFWFAMQDFQPDDTGLAAYKTMFAETAAKRDILLSAKAIILDLRFNQGGSSTWSKSLAGLLWGQSRLERQVEYHNRNVEIWWRPTQGNENAALAYKAEFTKQGNTEMVGHFDNLISSFAAARKEGKTFWVEGSNEGQPEIPTPAANIDGDPPALTTPVYVIVPGQCASACLDAIDYFKRFPNTKLIGAPSSADSSYMEVREAPLPSGMGGAIIPMKIWMGRPRGNGEYYTPDIMMTDFDWSTANFQAKIEADLKAR